MNMRETKRPTSQSELDEAETTLGIVFPRAYRDWLLQHNGGIPERREFRYKLERGAYAGSMVDRFLAVYDGQFSSFFAKFYTFRSESCPPGHRSPNRLPGSLVPIAHDPFGNLICMEFDGPDQGKIYFWDHEEELQAVEPDGKPTYRNCHLIADSFQEFIDGLF